MSRVVRSPFKFKVVFLYFGLILIFKEHADKITCPSCQSDCQLGPQGVSGLLVDYGVSSSDCGLDLAGCTGCKSRESSAVARSVFRAIFGLWFYCAWSTEDPWSLLKKNLTFFNFSSVFTFKINPTFLNLTGHYLKCY